MRSDNESLERMDACECIQNYQADGKDKEEATPGFCYVVPKMQRGFTDGTNKETAGGVAVGCDAIYL